MPLLSCQAEGCAFTTKHAASLKGHALRRHLPRAAILPFACAAPGCGFSSFTNVELKGHARRHASAKPFVCPEPSCGRVYKLRGALTRHARTHNGTARRFACGQSTCDYVASDSQKLHCHHKLMHDPVSGALSCRICPFIAADRMALICHARSHGAQRAVARKSGRLAGPALLDEAFHAADVTSSEILAVQIF